MPTNDVNQRVTPEQFNATVDRLRADHQSISWGDRLLTFDKSFGFKASLRGGAALATITGSHQYDQYSGPDGIGWRLNTLCWAAQTALRTGGAFVECGVFKGDMAWTIGHVLGFDKIPAFYLFDSFEGFSPTMSSDDDYPPNTGYLEFANKIYRGDGDFYQTVARRFAPHPNVKVVPGFLPEALAGVPIGPIGFLHVDLNSPRAEVAVLRELFPKIVPGGMVVLDDYGWIVFRKQKEAEDELMAEFGYEILELPTGQGLIVKR